MPAPLARLMPSLLPLILGLWLVCPTASAQTEQQLFDRLDSLLADSRRIADRKLDRIESLRRLQWQAGMSRERMYDLNDRMYEEYKAFRYDSAYKYVGRNIALARSLGDSHRYNVSVMKLVHILSVAGLFDQAEKQMAAIDTLTLTGDDRLAYYQHYCDLYLFNSEFTTGTDFFDANLRRTQQFRAAIIREAPPQSLLMISYKASYTAEYGKVREAADMLTAYLRRSQLRSGDRDYSILTSMIAYFYYKLDEPSSRKRYLLLSAISDVQGAVMENNSLRELSSMLFDEGDYDRAYRYLHRSIEDATFYGTRLRNIQASQLIPKVVEAYQASKTRQTHIMYGLLALLGVAVVFLIVALAFTRLYLHRYREASRQVSRMNQQLGDTVDQLRRSNRLLEEGSDIREQYIGRFLDLSSTLMDRAEEYRRQANRLARDGKMKELYDLLKGSNFSDENKSLFYENFDTAFLNIYVDFVEKVNLLLEPEGRIYPKDERLSTELRILALIRLGITETQKIASILRSSISTIYTYRSKLKARALDKDNFERQIAEID